MIDDQKFVAKLNQISRNHGGNLPVLRGSDTPSGEFLEEWARFLENCVKDGVPLSDPRWQRIGVRHEAGYTRFILEVDEDGDQDPDFRVGLQLLMGILETDDE